MFSTRLCGWRWWGAVHIAQPLVQIARLANYDVTVIDPNLEWTIDVSKFASKSRNCPFDGWRVRGRAVATILAGEVRFQLA